jgi:hypothetical protein
MSAVPCAPGAATDLPLSTHVKRACLVVVGTKKQLRRCIRVRKHSTQPDWMQVVRPVPLSVPLQSTCGIWRKKSDVARLVPEHRRLRVGNAGEDIHARVRTYLGEGNVFEQELHALAGIECPAEGRARALAERYRNFDIVFPQGSFDPEVDRTLADTATREFLEETGISLASQGLHRSVPVSPWSDGALSYASGRMFRDHLALAEDCPPGLRYLGVTTAGSATEGMGLFLVQLGATGGHSPNDGFCCGPPRELLTEADLLHVYTHTAPEYMRLSEEDQRSVLETMHAADLAHRYDQLRHYQVLSETTGTRKSSIPPVAELCTTRRRSERRSSGNRMSIDASYNDDDASDGRAAFGDGEKKKKKKKREKTTTTQKATETCFASLPRQAMQNPFALLLGAAS